MQQNIFLAGFRHLFAAAAVLGAVGLAGCGGGGDDGDSRVNTGNAEAVMNNILVKMGGSTATLVTGSPPSSTGTAASPKVVVGADLVTTTTSAGSTVDIPVSFQSDAAMTAIFAKIGGTSAFFQSLGPIGGKVAKAVPVSGAGQNFVITVELAHDFNEGQFCFAVSGTDANGLVSNADTACVQLVNTITQTGLDQPTAAGLTTSLTGTWLSSCQAFQTTGRSGSAKIGFTFDATNHYSQFLYVWDAPSCSGNPNTATTVVTGTLQIGATPVFLTTSSGSVQGFWATPVDFVPDQASTDLGAQPCFNVLRFVNQTSANDTDRFFLGVPLGFSLTGEADSPAPCASAATRPDFLSANTPFTPGGTLPLNQAPVANAGPDQSVNPNALVTLTSAASADADGTIASRSWTQISGTSVTLSNATAPSPTFSAPATSGTLVFRLTVTDNAGATSQDDVTITVATNVLPVASAGPDLVRAQGSNVQLAGDCNDSDGTVASCVWTQTAGTPTVTLTGANTENASFTAPNVSPGTSVPLTFTLTATDNKGGTHSDTAVITIVNEAAPIANAGTDKTVKTGVTVNLNGGASSDSDGTVASYAWTQTAGPAVALTGANTATPSFTAPGAPGVLTFQLVVTDNVGLASTPDTVNVTVNSNAAPVANAGPNRFAEAGDQVSITGSGTDDGQVVSYHWTQTAGPQLSLQGTNSQTLTYTAPSLNTFPQTSTFQLTVTDNEGATGSDSVNVTVVQPFKLFFTTTGFVIDSPEFDFRITSNHPVGNWFTDQSNATPDGEGAVFDEVITDDSSCVVDDVAREVTCDEKFVKRYLGPSIAGCDVDTTSTATLTDEATVLTFHVDCVTNTGITVNGGQVGIGLNGGNGPFGNHQARSEQTGHTDKVTNSCTVDQGCQP